MARSALSGSDPWGRSWCWCTHWPPAYRRRAGKRHAFSDIEAGSGQSDLKSTTPAPVRTTITYEIAGRAYLADLYDPAQPIGAGLVLVPGFTPDGKDDQRLVELAFTLSRARFLVLVPDLQGPRQMRVRLEDSRGIADAVIQLAQMDLLQGQKGVGVVAISYAAGLAILATMESDAAASVRFLVAVGGYYDTTALATFVTTGKFRQSPADRWQTREPHPAAKWFFLASNIDLLDDAADRRILLAIAERRMDNPNAPVADLRGPPGSAGPVHCSTSWRIRIPIASRRLLREAAGQGIQAYLRRLSLRNSRPVPSRRTSCCWSMAAMTAVDSLHGEHGARIRLYRVRSSF